MDSVPLPRLEDADSRRDAIRATPLLNTALILLWMFLSIGAGRLWFGLSSDYYEYLIYYEALPATFSLLDTRFEPGFHAVAWVFRNWLRADISYLIMTTAALALGIKFYLFAKYLKHSFLASVLYVVMLYPIHEYTQYRVGVALAFGFLAIHLILEKRYSLAFLFTVLSFSFHFSSIALILVAIGAPLVRKPVVLISALLALSFGILVGEQFFTLFSDLAGRLNPLSASYLDNKAMLEGVSIFSVNNILLILAIISYILAGVYGRSQYHALFLTLAIVSLVPIVLLPNAPVVAQRTKEVFLLAIVFVACRSQIRLLEFPGFLLVVSMTGLLGYLWVSGGIILA